MTNSQNIFLTGFMGSGKTTQAKKLASFLKTSFIDLDHYIEEKEKCDIAEIFKKKSETYFRERESEYLKELITKNNNSVISLGGGTVCFYDNLQLVKQNGLLIYLQLPPAALCARIQESGQERPLLSGLSGEQLLKSIEKKLEEREKFYHASHITVNGLNLTTQLLHTAIVEYSQKNNR